MLQPQAAGATSTEIRSGSELQAAIGALVDTESGTSFGKTIVLPTGTIVLPSPLVLGRAQSGLSILGQNTTLYIAGEGPVVSFDDTGPTGIVFANINFSTELSGSSNACISNDTVVGADVEFFRCSFAGARFSISIAAQCRVSLLLCFDNTGAGSTVPNLNGRYIGGRHAIGAAIVVTGAGLGNVISGNAMGGAAIDTSASGGFNTITGNTRIDAGSAFAGTDNTTGGNT